MRSPSGNDDTVTVTPGLLRGWPLPQPGEDADKESRGQVLVVGGSAVTPGAVILAGVAALRAGAGKLQVATARSAAPAVAVAMPEALVTGLPETEDGTIDAAAGAKQVAELAGSAAAVLVGTGALDAGESSRLVDRVLPELDDEAVVVLDAGALKGLSLSEPLRRPTVLMPNVKEAAQLLGTDEDAVADDQRAHAVELVAATGATVALRSDVSWLTAPGERVYFDDSGNPGLATSGSGDVLAGVLVGLAARGATPLQAVVWAVHAHGTAGDRLAARVGPVGYLARELLDEVPPVLAMLAP